ncbi:MAG: hypothetical protein AAB870_04565 [Patescibacteria group bacterium]
MDIFITILLQFCLGLIIVGGAVAVILSIVALVHTVRILRQIEEVVEGCKDSVMRLCTLGGGAVSRIKQAIVIAQTIGGVISTLQQNRRRGKK